MTAPLPTPRDEPAGLLDEFLDRRLTAEQHAAMEQRCDCEPDLAAAVKCQVEIDESLVRYARTPDATSILAAAQARRGEIAGMTGDSHLGRAVSARGAAAGDTPVGLSGLSAWRRLAVAAVLLLGLVGSWQIYHLITGGPKGRYDPGPHRTLAQAYQHTIDAGFTANWECKDDRDFALVFYDQFGDLLSMNPPVPGGVQALGLKYVDVISPKTIGMLARVQGVPVMIFVDRLERDHDTDRAVPPGLSLFRRELGSLVLYELTPQREPGLLNHLKRPETLPEPVEGESPER